MFGSLSKLVMSLGRELFGLNVKSNQKLADIAKKIGIDTDDIASASDEAIQATLESAARSGAIDPREANAITIQIGKDAQEVVPEYNDLFGDLE
jgi:hypothetical protein